MMKYRNYLFDWDGSLGDSLPLWFENFVAVFAEFGVKMDYKMISEQVIGDWNGPAKFGVDNEEFFKKLEQRVLEKLEDVKLNPGAFDLINGVKRSGGKIGVLTTSKRSWVEPALKKNGVWEMMDVFLGKEDVHRFKPDPEIINVALEKIGGNKYETVMIGDTGKDVGAAKAAGVESVLYYPLRYRQFYEEQMQTNLGATKVIGDFGEMEI